MTEKNISQESRLKKMKKIRNYFFEEIDQNELMINENKKLCMTLNYIENFFTLVFASTICVSILLLLL